MNRCTAMRNALSLTKSSSLSREKKSQAPLQQRLITDRNKQGYRMATMNKTLPAGLQHCQNFKELAQLLGLRLPRFHHLLDKKTQVQILKGSHEERIQKFESNPEIVQRTIDVLLKSPPAELLNM
jgi:hypothetical protein